MSEWAQDLFSLRSAGFSEDEIAAESANRKQQLIDGGFSPKETDDYFGVKQPDMGPLKRVIADNAKAATAPTTPEGEPKPVKDIAEAFANGWGMNVNTLLNKARKGESLKQKTYVPPDGPWYYDVAQQAGTMIGDLPEMVAGAAAGGAAGGPVGAGAGAFAVPTAMRKSLMEYYEKGAIQDPADFIKRTASIVLDTTKSAVTGAATSLVGGKVGATLVEKAVMPAATKVLTAASEVATMTTMGKALEGELPTAKDFAVGGILVAGMHVATSAPSKMMHIYAETGVKPETVIQDAQTDPVLKQELLSPREKMPAAYEPLVEKGGEIAPISTENAPATPAEAPPSTPQDTILSKVGEKTPKEKTPYTSNTLYKDLVDKVDPIKSLLESVREIKDTTKLPEDTPVSKDGYSLARMADDYNAKVEHFVKKGTFDFETLANTGPSLESIVKPFKETNDLQGLKAYLISKRALELNDRGIKSGFDIPSAEQVVAEGGKYEEAASKLNDFQNAGLKYLKDSGVLSEKSFDAITEASKNYISFKRILEDGEVGGGINAKNPVKRIKGSDLSIQDPFQSMVENTQAYLRLAEKNRAVKATVDEVLSHEGQTLIEKQGTTQRPITVNAEEMQKAFDKAGVEADASAMTIFRKADRPLAKDEFEVYQDGKREVYKTTDPNVAEAIKSLDGNAPVQNVGINLMRGVTRVKRLGLTLTPDFILRHFGRNQFLSNVYSEAGGTPFVDVIKAIGDMAGKTDSYWDWKKSGGAGGAFLENDYSDLYKLNGESGNFMDKVWNGITKPVEWMEAAARLGEQSTRLAEYKRTVGEETSGDALFKGGMASRDITLDFQRKGARTAGFSAITAFFNAEVQGYDKVIQTFKNNPVGLTTKGLMFLTAPTLLNWWANKDDERYKEIPTWEKYAFWIFPTDKWEPEQTPNEADALPSYLVRKLPDGTREINRGTLFRFPKPQALGTIFGTLPEMIMDHFYQNNPDGLGQFEKTLLKSITPNLVPDLLAPIADQHFNKSTFTGDKIVPSHLEGILPQYQYTDYTTQTAKALSKMVMAVPFLGNTIGKIGPDNAPLASPMVIENYVKSWSGTTGMYALQLADKALQKAGITDTPNPPTNTLADIPIVKAFVARFPLGTSESIQEFQDKFQDNSKVLNTVKFLTKQGNMAEANSLMQANESHMQNLSGVDMAIKNQGHFIRMVYENPDIKPEEKRQIIDGAYYGMIETAKNGLKQVHEFEKTLNEQRGK